MPYELRWPYSMQTFENMKLDDAVGTVLNLNYTMIEEAFSTVKVKPNKHSAASKEAAEFIEWCLHNMDGQSFMQAVKNIETFKEKGFSIVEKVYTQVNEGKYRGRFKLKELANRPQISLYTSSHEPFEYVDSGRKIASVLQDINYFYNDIHNHRYIAIKDIHPNGYVRIPRKKFMLFGDNATDSTPLGNPILRSCYKAWKEKQLIEDYETTGVAKDMAGIIKLTFPAEIIQQASADPNSPAAQMINQLQTDAANVHAGDQAFFLLPSDLQEGSSSSPDYGVELMGIQGGGKQYKTSDIIAQKRKAIFDTFGAGNVILGENGGSYALMEGKNAIHAHFIKRDIKIITDVLNKDLVPQLLKMNDIELDYKDIPVIEAGDIEPTSLDEVSKAVQRIAAVGFMPKSPEVVNQLMTKIGFDFEVDENTSTENLMEMLTGVTSRSGDGMSEGLNNGVGTSTSNGGDRSSGNAENAVTKAILKGGIKFDAKGYYAIDEDGSRLRFTKDDLPEELLDVIS